MNEETMATDTLKPKRRGIKRGGVGVGTTSLLVIFTMLCMTTLALLALSAAISNKRIQTRGVDTTAALALSNGKSDEKLGEMDSILLEFKNGTNLRDNEYINAAVMELEAAGCEKVSNDTVRFAVDMTDDRILYTEIRICPYESEIRYDISARYTFYAGEWSQGGIDIWDGQG